MTQFENLLDRILVDLLSDRIVERRRARTHTALVLFAATDLGLETALAQLRQLRQAGWLLETVFAPEALPLTEGRLQGLDAVAAEGSAAELLGRSAMVLVPTLSITLAAKVALGIADDPLSALLQGALERGLRIVAARDGACPGSRDRRERGLLPAPAYRATMSRHLQALSDYGIELSWAARLAATVDKTTASARQPALAREDAGGRRSGVFGLREARGFPGTELHLGRDVIITPAAVEELGTRDIRLVRADSQRS